MLFRICMIFTLRCKCKCDPSRRCTAGQCEAPETPHDANVTRHVEMGVNLQNTL
jgi:hypothetical protein